MDAIGITEDKREAHAFGPHMFRRTWWVQQFCKTCLSTILRDWTLQAQPPSRWKRRHGIWLWDFYKDAEWDDHTRSLFGVSPKVEVSNAMFFDHAHPDDRGKVEQALVQAVEKQEHYKLTYRIHRADDGTTRFLKSEGDAYYDRLGRPVRMMGTYRHHAGCVRATIFHTRWRHGPSD
jgi:PAS domain-containing protein